MIKTCTPRERSATTSAAIPRTGLRSEDADSDAPAATVIAVVATDFEESGFFCIWTVACGIDFEGGTFPPTLAVSFFISACSGAGATGLADEMEGGLGAEGGTEAAGGITGAPGGFGAAGGIVGGLGIEGAAGGAGGSIEAPLVGGFGIEGIMGGFGAKGIEGIVGGFGIVGAGGAIGAAEAAGAGIVGLLIAGGTADAGAGAPGTSMGLGGRLIIAVSRGLEATGMPSRRAGRTIRTVSFLGSAIVCSEVVKGRIICWAVQDIHKIPCACQ